MFRALAPIAAAALLTACGAADDPAPFVDSRTPPALAARFFAPDGWAWGLVQVGDNPAQRYGVAGSSRAPRAQILILPAYGESAELWFETVGDLTARGFTVWVLEGAGQGGSGRFSPRRDLGHLPNFGADVAAVQAMIDVVIRPGPDEPLFLLASQEAVTTGLLALGAGAPVDGMIASAPRAPEALSEAERLAAQTPLGSRPPPGWRPWRRDSPRATGASDPVRAEVQHAWQTANPDLRMAGPSLGWRAAYEAASRTAMAEAGAVRAPVLMVTPGAPNAWQRELCRRLPACEARSLPEASGPLHLERDPKREGWLKTIGAFIAEESQTSPGQVRGSAEQVQ